MDQNDVEDRPQARASVAESEDALILPAAPRRSSTSRALKVAGLTTLACLLVASQVFTAYMVFGQKEQIRSLQRDTEKMAKQLTRAAPGVRGQRFPIAHMPMLLDFTLDGKGPTAKTPKHGDINDSPSQESLTDCQMRAAHPQLYGTYTPKCDEQGRYLPIQCWSSIGFCWCVKEDGTPIAGTMVRGHPDCQRGLLMGTASFSKPLQGPIGADGQ